MSVMAPAGTATVTIRNLTVAYRRRSRLLRVLDDISLEIRAGEAYGLVGESGCGKTTVALSVMRYLADNAVVQQGEIEFAGHNVLTLRERELQALRGDRMAMVYQEPASALNPSIRVGRQIAEIYRQHRAMNAADAMAAAAEMLSTVQISDRDRVLRRYPHELSGGQQQRVMLAMALATDPDLLVLDEPTTGLDATVEAEVLDLVEQLRDRFHAAILFVSHNLGIVSRMCERMGVLYAGRLIEQGPAQELFAEPRHPYTDALLRCMPRVGMRKHVDRLEPIPGSLPPLGTQAAGCVYAARCPLARDRCREQAPPLADAGPGHLSRCFYFDEVSELAPAAPPGETAPAALTGERLVEVRGLVKSYRDAMAVAGVDLEVGRGEVVGLVGESGSGKTSLAKCLVGLIDVTDGDLVLDGQALSRRRTADQRKALQMVFQNPDGALNPRKTVRSILARAVGKLAFAVGWPQAARRDRPGLCRLTAARGLRRAHLGPGRLGAGRHPQPARRPAANRRGLLPVHFARPCRGALHRRADRSHVPGADRGDRPRRRRVLSTAPPLHRGAGVGHPRCGSRGAGAHPPPRPAAQPELAAQRVSLPYPLPPQARHNLRAGGAPVAGRRGRAPVPMPHRPGRPAPRPA
jgi:peptide/nickel transport system ATP-binding protein